MNVTALVDGTTGSGTCGEVVERVQYDPYGRLTFCDGSRTPTQLSQEPAGTSLYVYDAFNRLRRVQKEDDPEWVDIAAYRYDPLGRRVRKEVSNGGLSGYIPDEDIFCLYAGVQCVEERDAGPQQYVARQYVWGLYVDELVQQREVE